MITVTTEIALCVEMTMPNALLKNSVAISLYDSLEVDGCRPRYHSASKH